MGQTAGSGTQMDGHKDGWTHTCILGMLPRCTLTSDNAG
jgi:hypothetical protein